MAASKDAAKPKKQTPNLFQISERIIINVTSGMLLRDEEPVSIQPKLQKLLLLLAQDGGHSLTRHDILETLPSNAGGRNTVNNVIHTLRGALNVLDVGAGNSIVGLTGGYRLQAYEKNKKPAPEPGEGGPIAPHLNTFFSRTEGTSIYEMGRYILKVNNEANWRAPKDNAVTSSISPKKSIGMFGLNHRETLILLRLRQTDDCKCSTEDLKMDGESDKDFLAIIRELNTKIKHMTHHDEIGFVGGFFELTSKGLPPISTQPSPPTPNSGVKAATKLIS